MATTLFTAGFAALSVTATCHTISSPAKYWPPQAICYINSASSLVPRSQKKNNPAQQLEDTAQLFLGTRIQCAQCHHHPFEKWSQHDYYSFSAFFSRVGRKPGRLPGEEMVYHKRGVAKATNKKNNKSVQPAGLGATPLELGPDEDPRQALVDWMSAKDNKFFSHTLVNRYWKHFFSRGLVEPEDDMRETNPATNPALLDGLAEHFIKVVSTSKDLSGPFASPALTSSAQNQTNTTRR